jgi:hypothetical protein
MEMCVVIVKSLVKVLSVNYFFLFNNVKVHGCLISDANFCERILKVMVSFVQVSKP